MELKYPGFMILCLLAITVSAYGDYTITPKVDGETTVLKDPGDSFTLELVMSSDANDTLTSAVFTLQFSRPGLVYNSYTWDPNNFNTGTGDDFSEPRGGDLPATLDVNTWVDVFEDPNAVDVYFDNFASGDGSFAAGTLLSLNLTIPSDFPLSSVLITPTVGDFEGDQGPVSTAAATFRLNVPEPATASLLVLGCLALLRRTKRPGALRPPRN